LLDNKEQQQEQQPTTDSSNSSMTANEEMDQQQLRDELDALNAQVTAQGATVRTLKKEGAAAEKIAEAVEMLQQLKLQAAEKMKIVQADQPQFNRKAFDDLVLRKMFVVPSFEIHGGVKGLFDLGPPSCALKVRVPRYHQYCLVYLVDERKPNTKNRNIPKK
jgi:hypothetical protein